MDFNNIDIKRIANIARIHLTLDEEKEFKNDLISILTSFEVIKEIDTKNIKPTFRPIKITNQYREDKIGESLNKIEIMKNLKNKENFYFKGPKTQKK